MIISGFQEKLFIDKEVAVCYHNQADGTGMLV